MNQGDEEKRSQGDSDQGEEGYVTSFPNHHPYEPVVALVGNGERRQVHLLLVQGTLWMKVPERPIPLEEMSCGQTNTRNLTMWAGSSSTPLHVYGCCLSHIAIRVKAEVHNVKEKASEETAHNGEAV